MPEINPLTNNQIFLKKIAENTGSDYDIGDVSEINPLTIDQIFLKEIAANTAGQAGDISELEGKVADNTSAIEAIVNVNAGCNLLPCSSSSQTIEGITWTVNSDGTVTASGTATANGSVLTYHRFTTECVLNGKEVVLKGCPAGGSDSSYGISCFRVAGSSSYLDNRNEYGEGVKFTWNNDSSRVVPEIQLYIAPNYAIQGTLTFNPMLYDARLKPTGYVPYAMTNRELTESVTGISSQLGNTEIYRAGSNEATSVTFTGIKIKNQLRYPALFIGNGNGTPFMAACALYAANITDVAISDSNMTIAVSNVTDTTYDLTIGGINTWGQYALMVFYL